MMVKDDEAQAPSPGSSPSIGSVSQGQEQEDSDAAMRQSFEVFEQQLEAKLTNDVAGAGQARSFEVFEQQPDSKAIRESQARRAAQARRSLAFLPPKCADKTVPEIQQNEGNNNHSTEEDIAATAFAGVASMPQEDAPTTEGKGASSDAQRHGRAGALHAGAYSHAPGMTGPERRSRLCSPPVQSEHNTSSFSFTGQDSCTSLRVFSEHSPSGGGLAVANAVDSQDLSIPADLQQAQDVDLDASQERRARKVNRERCAIMLMVVLMPLLVGIILVIVFVPDWGSQNQETQSKSRTISKEEYVLSLLPVYTQEHIAENATTPQAKAYSWIMADPNLNTYSDERIIQRFALGTLFYATDGEEWRDNANWVSYEVHECDWHAQNATKIVTNMYILAGEPVPEMLLTNVINPFSNESFPCEDPIVKKYTHLWLSANGLKGHLPPEIHLLTSIKSIDLSLNGLTGTVLSTEIGKLSLLESLAGARNQFSGTIPTEIGLLSRLQTILLRENKMIGTIPTQFGLLSDSLRVLDLQTNQLDGSIPQALGSLEKSISALLLYENWLSGTIPAWLGQLSTLTWLSLDKNKLLGPIPSQLGMLESLKDVWLSQNSLTGTVPLEIGNLVINGSLKLFHIYDNNLTGTLTDDLCLIDTVLQDNSQVIGCNCTCSFQRHGLQLCSPLPEQCT